MKRLMLFVAVLALAAATYKWPTTETVPAFTSWLGPVDTVARDNMNARVLGGAGGAATITFNSAGGGGGGGTSGASGEATTTVPHRSIITGVHSNGTRFTWTPDGGTIYVQK